MKHSYDLNEYFVYLVLFAFIWVWAGCGQPTEQTSLSNDTAGANGSVLDEFVTLMNAHRESVGCKPLVATEVLNGVAQEHSEDMSVNKYFSHIDLKNRTPFDRITLANVQWRGAAENIVLSAGGAQGALDMWLSSPGHRANIENCAYTHHGVGVADKADSTQKYWTQVFVIPR